MPWESGRRNRYIGRSNSLFMHGWRGRPRGTRRYSARVAFRDEPMVARRDGRREGRYAGKTHGYKPVFSYPAPARDKYFRNFGKARMQPKGILWQVLFTCSHAGVYAIFYRARSRKAMPVLFEMHVVRRPVLGVITANSLGKRSHGIRCS